MSAIPHEACLLVFTKPARPGRVKTRLIGPLTAEEAAELHRAFLDDLLGTLAGGPFEIRLAWALDPGEEPPPCSLPGERQVGADLGARLHHSLAEAARRYPRVAAVGSDHPTLSRERVEEAFRRLEEGCDLALGPAEDGGYYLIAARAEALSPEIFRDVPWSTSEVLAATLSRLDALGLEPCLLPEEADVDTAEDLAALTARLAAMKGACPHTRALLARWGRLPCAC
jgi:rSAM/selenodomain-associated transferase 1